MMKSGYDRIEFYDGICNTPALPIIVKAWDALLDAGLQNTRDIPVGWDNKAFVAFDSKKRPIAVLSFARQDWSKEIVVCMGWVSPAHRRRGIYSALWVLLVAYAQREKIPTISGRTFTQNKPMRATAKAHRRRETGVWLEYEVPQLKKEKVE